MLFECLDVLTELESTMSLEVQSLTRHDGAWAQCIPEVVLRRQTVQPEHARLCHLRHQSGGDLLKWQGVIDGPHPFLYRSDKSLNFANVLIARCFIQYNAQASQLTS